MREPRLVKHRGKFAVRYWDEAATDWRRSSLGTADASLARTRFAEWKQQVERLSRPQRITIRHIVEGYVNDRVAEGVPVQRIQDAWKRLGPTFADLLPSHVDKRACQRYARERGASVGTVVTELGILRSACRWAEREWKAEAAVVWLPRKPPPRERYLTRDEADRLLDGCEAPHVSTFILLALHTGGRAGAILGLTWQRVDFRAGRILLHDPDRSATRKGRATVPINDTLRVALEGAREGALTPFVVEWAGKPVVSIKHAFARSAERAGLLGVTPHVLRHTAAVWMAEGGIPMAEIAQYLGHTDSRTTERIYARFSPEYLRRAADVLAG